MARVRPKTDLDLDSPTLVEGLPGVGLVGKIATDHLVDTLDMTYVASVDCSTIPRVAIYDEGDRGVFPPVRIYANEQQDVLALQSDIPISRGSGDEFAECLTTWIQDNDVTPLYLSGLPLEDYEPGHVPEVYGIATAGGAARLDDLDIATPPERGVVGGPTGALINRAVEYDLDATGLVVESDPKFPDPAAAKHLIDDAIEPLTGVTVPTDNLVERAEDIREQKEQFAKRMQEASEEESTQAQPLRMFQ
jgi:uncharacterized protein